MEEYILLLKISQLAYNQLFQIQSLKYYPEQILW